MKNRYFAVVKSKPSCALCETEIPEEEIICDDCWEIEKKNWKLRK